MFFKKEKKVIELIDRHMEITEECLTTALKTITHYLKEEITEAKSLAIKVDNIETQADFIRHEVYDKLYSGAYFPIQRGDIHSLVERIDEVSDAAEACCDFFLAQRPEIPDDMKDEFLNVSKESIGIIVLLKEVVKNFVSEGGDIAVTREKAKQIGIIESNVDTFAWDLTRTIFTSSLDFAHKIHLKLCLDTIAEISDRVEDTADQIEVIVMKTNV